MMASFSDLSQISDISGISRISRSSSLRWPAKEDSLSTSGQASVFHEPNKTLISSCRGILDLDKNNKAFTECETSIAEYAHAKLIYDCIKETALNKDNRLSEATVKKLKELVTIHEVEKYLHLPDSSKDLNEKLTLLGITDLPKSEMSDGEMLEIKCTVEAKMREKIDEFLTRYENSGGNLKELEKKNQFLDRKPIPEGCEIELLHWRDKIEEVCSEYEKNLLNCGKCLNTWVELKHGDMTNIHHEKAEILLVKAQVAEIRAKITKLSCTMRMYKETPTTTEAFKILNSELDDKILEIKEEIRKKDAMKKSYDDLKGTEYDDLLKKYCELCKAIEKKTIFMQRL